MPRLIRLDTGKDIGAFTDVQLTFLISQLEEDKENDTDCSIDRDMLELFSDNGADPELVGVLEKGLGDDDEMEISWEAQPE